MKVLFLDIDGVCNCRTTTARFNHMFGIDPYMTLLVNRICEETGAEIILSSTWRCIPESRAEVYRVIFPNPVGETPDFRGTTSRGTEIKAWLDRHPEVTKYAILDDNSDMLEEQMPNFFKTSWERGLTPDIALKVIEHLNP